MSRVMVNQSLAQTVQEFSKWTQQEFMSCVAVFADQFPKGHPGHGRPIDYTWAFVPRFAMRRLAGSLEDWVRWSAEQESIWIQDFQPCSGERMQAYWLPRPWSSPV